MSKICKTCKGRGQWTEQEIIDNEVTLVGRYCNDCLGTGVSQDAEDGDDFDVDGESYENDN